MKAKVVGLPTSITVEGREYPVEHKGGRWLRARVNTDRAKYPEYEEGRNLAQLEKSIRAYEEAKEQKRNKAKAGDSTVPVVHALYGQAEVIVRGWHSSTDKLLITFVDGGQKDSVLESRLSPLGIDLARLAALEAEWAKVQEENEKLGTRFYNALRDLEDTELVVRYRIDTDDYEAELLGFKATDGDATDVMTKIGEQIRNDRLPWTIVGKHLFGANEDSEVVRTVDVTDLYGSQNGYPTREEAEHSLELTRREADLMQQIIEAKGKFDYAAELAKVAGTHESG